MNGGTGNDVLIAGPNDNLTGGGGNDSFVFNPGFGKDVITDFSLDHDTLNFSHTVFTNAQQAIAHTHDVNGNAVITMDAADSVTLLGVTTAQLTAHLSDFHFL
jgi:Ca2+-binding RTX toxin-like protein